MSEKEPDWIWYGRDEEGRIQLSYGRWQMHPNQKRYKLASIQPTEHDHPTPEKPQTLVSLHAHSIGEIDMDGNVMSVMVLTGSRDALLIARQLVGKDVILKEDQ